MVFIGYGITIYVLVEFYRLLFFKNIEKCFQDFFLLNVQTFYLFSDNSKVRQGVKHRLDYSVNGIKSSIDSGYYFDVEKKETDLKCFFQGLNFVPTSHNNS